VTKARGSRAATPAVAAVEIAGIIYRLHTYDVDPTTQDDYGVAVAQALGVDPERVYKTLVAKIDGTQLVCAVVPVARRLDLKALARAVGGRQSALADRSEAERRTGYVRGGISPLGQRQQLPVVVDESALAQQTVYVSAGKRGLQLEMAPADLVRLTQAEVAAVAD
jgi:Cys-tRNA(Pro)/Cys-tRNA(Cys) deacylase